jgi:hypothetical protein
LLTIGDYSRGGKTRGDKQAADYDMGCEKKHTPFGVVNEGSGQFYLSFGSSAKTSDFIIVSLYAWWGDQLSEAWARATHLQITADNGPESNDPLLVFHPAQFSLPGITDGAAVGWVFAEFHLAALPQVVVGNLDAPCRTF